MKKYVDGKYLQMTAEEIAALPRDTAAPTVEERLAALEAIQEKLLGKIQAVFSV